MKRQDLVRALGENRGALQGLERLASRMKVEVFDDEDREHVSQAIDLRRQEVEKLEKEIRDVEARETAYAELRAKIRKTLDGREEVLGTENEVLSANPDLLAKLAQKQLEMESFVKGSP